MRFDTQVTKVVNTEMSIIPTAVIKDTVVAMLESRGTTLNWLAVKIDMTRSGLEKALDKGTLDCTRLFQIANILNVSACELIGCEQEKNKKSEAEQVQLLNRIIEDKVKLIKTLEDYNALLRDKKI